jgi:hypothetical protein
MIACTDEFRAITITIVNTVGAPVPDATVTSTVLPTPLHPGSPLTPVSSGGSPSGTYVIVDDLSRSAIRESGDSVRVTAQLDAGPLTTATYFINVPSGCHVNKVSGPDTLVVS